MSKYGWISKNGYNINVGYTCLLCKRMNSHSMDNKCQKCKSDLIKLGSKFRALSKYNIKQWSKTELLYKYGVDNYESVIHRSIPNEINFYLKDRRWSNLKSKSHNLSQVSSFLEENGIIKTRNDKKKFKKIKNNILKKHKKIL